MALIAGIMLMPEKSKACHLKDGGNLCCRHDRFCNDGIHSVKENLSISQSQHHELQTDYPV